VEEETGNIDVEKIEIAITEKTKAIIPVHLYGQMCDMKAINEIARKYNLFVIEDAAHCIEGQRDGIGPGQLSDAAVFSFYATKNITSGEGGAIVTNNRDLYEKLIKYRLHGMSKNASERHTAANYQHWDMELLGYKCNMSDLQASLLEPQLKNIEKYLLARENICMQYENSLFSFKNIKFPKVMKNSKHARHLFTTWVDRKERYRVLHDLLEQGIGVAVIYLAVHLLTIMILELRKDTFLWPSALATLPYLSRCIRY